MTDDIQSKIKTIKQYNSKKSFWSEFPDDRPYNKEDHLHFLLPIASKIRKLDVIEENEKRAILQKLKALWEVNAEDLGPKATPQDIAVSFVGFSMVRMYQRLEEGDEQWAQSLNLVYDSYFTKERIDKYNSFKIIK